MSTERKNYERANPVSKTAVTTLIARANAGYEKAEEILDRLNVDRSEYTGYTELDELVSLASSLIHEFRHVGMSNAALETGVQNIFDLPCGYSQRVFEMREKGKTYIGGDLPAVVESFGPVMNEMLTDAQKEKAFLEVVDVTNFESLKAAVDKADGPVCITMEGLTVYLNKEEKVRLFTNIRRLLADKGGCWLNADVETSGYYRAALGAVAGDRVEEVLGVFLKGFSSQSDMDILGNVIGNKNGTAKNVGEFQMDYAGMEKIYNSYGLKLERVPFFKEGYELNMFSKMTPEQIGKLKFLAKDVCIWKLTADPDYVPPKARESKVTDNDLAIDFNYDGAIMNIKLSGRIDSLTAPTFLTAWEKENEEKDVQTVVVDVSELGYISSAGLRVLLIIKKALPDQELVLKGVKPEIREILETTGFIDMFTKE